jgi:hypothetical protein
VAAGAAAERNVSIMEPFLGSVERHCNPPGRKAVCPPGKIAQKYGPAA